MTADGGTARSSQERSSSITAIATAFLITSLVVFFCSCWIFEKMYSQSGNWVLLMQKVSTFTNGIFFALTILQLILAGLGVVAAIGLFRLLEWARGLAVFLSFTFLLLLFCAELIFFAGVNQTGRGGMSSAAYLLLYGAFFVLAIPFCIWWLVALNRQQIRSQFR